MPEYANQAGQLTLLKAIDFNDIDFVSIEFGTNDWNSGTMITLETYDPMTIKLYRVIKTLLTYPHLKF